LSGTKSIKKLLTDVFRMVTPLEKFTRIRPTSAQFKIDTVLPQSSEALQK
jgi:hypothetical protein